MSQAKGLSEHLKEIAGGEALYCSVRADEHHVQARTWSGVNRWLNLPAAVLAGAAGTAIIADSTNETVVLLGGVAALVVAALTAASHVLAADQTSTQHKQAYDGFYALATRFEMFRDVTLELSRTDEQLTKELSGLIDKRDQLAAEVPETSRRARTAVKRKRPDDVERLELRGAPPK